MTQEEKNIYLKGLLLKDLCARLPYGVKAHTKIGTDITVLGLIDDTVKDETEDSFDISFVKPYLRPMSSMTEEEKIEYSVFFNYDGVEYPDDYIDWLNEKMFDHRGLIEKGLALEAPEGMYKI